VELGRANVRGALLEHANLRQSQLWGCDLREAMLARADLSGAVLQQGDLSHAALALAKVEVTDFCGAQLHEASSQQAWFQRCDFTMASLLDLQGYESLLG
ncbi:pentapeptide repeat-containing protein, partial [Serratia marcescens]|uniref:pentapeptide repeat-containing protein n=1 Tax=Serratia marcescens TaxID=615 RepID=UPI001BD27F12